jgi:hypothetical protein
MSLVTIERGAIRVIMVSRPEGDTFARGLIMTLSNPSGVQFTPVSAPIVLKRIAEATPQLGFIKPDSSDYASYWQELEAVMPNYGSFALASGSRAPQQTRPVKPVEDVRLTVVR